MWNTLSRSPSLSLSALCATWAVLGGACAAPKPKPKPAQKETQAYDDVLLRQKALAEKAYLWSYPGLVNYRVMMATLAGDGANPEELPFNTARPGGRLCESNSAFGGLRDCNIVETLAWIDMREGPVLVELPAAGRSERSVELFDFMAQRIGGEDLAKRATQDARFLVKTRNQEPQKDPKVDLRLESPTHIALLLIRTQIETPSDLRRAEFLEKRIELKPLEAKPIKTAEANESTEKNAKTKKNATATKKSEAKDAKKTSDSTATQNDPGADKNGAAEKGDQEQEAEQTPSVALIPWQEDKANSPHFVGYTNLLLSLFVDLADSGLEVDLYKGLGVAPGKPFEVDAVDGVAYTALVQGMAEATQKIAQPSAPYALSFGDDAEEKSAWTVVGAEQDPHGADMLTRAVAMNRAPYPPRSEEVFMLYLTADAKGKALDGSKALYGLSFNKEELPSNDAFWAMTVYRREDLQPFLAPGERGTFHAKSKKIKRGGYNFPVRATRPDEWYETANWIKVPEAKFFLVLRTYGASSAERTKLSSMPKVQMLKSLVSEEAPAKPKAKEAQDDDGFSFSVDETG